MRRILVTGAAGYIGSHLVKSLCEYGYQVIALDNHTSSLNWSQIRPFTSKVIISDINDIESNSFNEKLDLVIHLAAKKSISESHQNPNLYYKNNVLGSLKLINSLKLMGVERFLFSSSASVYRLHADTALSEGSELSHNSPYSSSKINIENFLKNEPSLNSVSFRFFNVGGAAQKYFLSKRDTNLIPMFMSSIQRSESLKIYGNDYETLDGTCVRDYIHIGDLLDAHLLMIEKMFKCKFVGETYNIGTGIGTSVLQIADQLRRLTSIPSEIEFRDRRVGDYPIVISDNKKLRESLNWKPKRGISEILESSWKNFVFRQI